MSDMKYVKPSELNPAPWRATYMLSPDLAVLARSIIDCTEQEAMILHIQMNRGRGSVVTKRLSALVRTLYVSGAATEKDLCSAFNMTLDEFEVLLDGTIVKHRAIKDHIYSRAWVPIESDVKLADEPLIEVPPNGDR